MFLSNIKLWNFRKFGSDSDFDLEKPNLCLPLKKGLNVLIGENDSGKSAVIDAIKLVLGTHSFEWSRVRDKDFYNKTTRLRIELLFELSTAEKAKNFTQWSHWVGEKNAAQNCLRLNYDVRRNAERVFPADVKAGPDDEGSQMSAEAREYLKVTYLKPLRDAMAELVPRRNSRLAQIFQEHEAFRGKEKDHYLMDLFRVFNTSIERYFEAQDASGAPLTNDLKGKELKEEIDKYIQAFSGISRSSDISVAEGSLKSILEKLELAVAGEINPGLGTLNRLFMASELVHLNKKDWTGLRLALIEELEAHLHPPAQMQIIESLQRELGLQIILTTHSPNLASKVKLDNLIICQDSLAFPMGKDSKGMEFTTLDAPDHKFLECFLDVTKSNLFFARGVIMVEGWAEEILLPPLAKKMKKAGLIARDLTEAGVSVVNVGGTSFLRYSKIFVRREPPMMGTPVAIVTDVDVRAYSKTARLDADGKAVKDETGNPIYDYLERQSNLVAQETDEEIVKKETTYNSQRVKVFVAPQWTLEYCLFKSSCLSSAFRKVFQLVHPQVDANDLERELAKKLINKLNKVDIAYQLARFIEDDLKKDPPEIVIDENDKSIAYLLEAIKHACGD